MGDTEFASAERSTQDQIRRQSRLISRSRQFNWFASLIPDPVLVLNQNRQIVFANPAAASVFDGLGNGDPFGLRPGEALRCEHALAATCGCGTSAFCRYCGAVTAILASLPGGQDVQECRITQHGNGEPLLFLCYAYPLNISGEAFCLFIMKDISKERRMQIFERVFFHDIKNTLAALNGWVDLLKDADSPERVREVSRVLAQLSSDLVDEVNAQELLTGAEGNRLAISITNLDSLSLLKETAASYRQHDIARGKLIALDPQAASVHLRSDAALLKRVLGNMIRNALEAIGEGETVTLGCVARNNEVSFLVHNPGTIPADVQPQIFKWSFSTKGKGRGLGTYAMRLFSERYLRGSVSFTSTPEHGTTFEARYPLSLDAYPLNQSPSERTEGLV